MDLRCGNWDGALDDVRQLDALICDPPYSARTHDATNDHIAGGVLPDGAKRQSLSYASWTPLDVAHFVSTWAPRCRGWMACMTDDTLMPTYRAAFDAAGLYSFAAVPIIQKRPRLLGDGPSSWAVYLMVARPRTRQMATWGCLPGAYDAPTEKLGIVAGAKPLGLMRAIVRDYSRPGDLVCDPCAGGGTTLLAAAIEGRRAVGAEMDPATFAKAKARLDVGYTPDMFAG